MAGNGNGPKEYIERLDNPELSKSEQFNLEMEADHNAQGDYMMAMRDQEDCSPTREEIEREVMEDEKRAMKTKEGIARTWGQIMFLLEQLRDCRNRGPSPGLHKFSIKNAIEILESIESEKEPGEMLAPDLDSVIWKEGSN